MGDNNRKALKAGFWYTASNFTVKAAAFITTPIFTRLLTTEQVGAFSNVTSWFAILAILTTFDLYASVSVARFDYRDSLDEYISSCLVLSSSITAAFYVTVLIFRDFFLQLFGIDELSLHLIFLYCLVYPALQMFQIKNRIEYKYRLSTFLSLASVLGATLISLLFVFLFENKLDGRLIGHFVPHIALNAAIYVYILIKGRKVNTKYWKYAIAICLPLIWHTLANNLLSSSDRIMITKFCGETSTALYSVAYSCAHVVSILWTSMNSAWSPWAYEMMDEKNYSALKKASKPYMLFFALIVAGGLLIAPELLLLMGGKKYVSAVQILPPIMIGYVFQFVYSLYVNIEFYSKKQKYIAIGTIVAAAVNIGLNWIFVPIWGYVAAAYTTLVGYIVLFAVHFFFVKSLKKLNWYDTKFNLIFLCLSLAFLPVILVLYRFPLLRYIAVGALVAAILTVGIICRSEIAYTVKNRRFHFALFREKLISVFLGGE